MFGSRNCAEEEEEELLEATQHACGGREKAASWRIIRGKSLVRLPACTEHLQPDEEVRWSFEPHPCAVGKLSLCLCPGALLHPSALVFVPLLQIGVLLHLLI